MIWYITLKDIFSFFKSEKKVFIWLLICMICGSFVLNYSYSFAQYRGDVYEYNSGEAVARYKINGNSAVTSASEILEKLSARNFPEVNNYQLFGKSESGYKVVGSSYISENSSSFTGIWKEGYASAIQNIGNVCAVNSELLDYGERLKMTDENITLDGDEYTIRGVFESIEANTDIVIFADNFINKFDRFDSLWITFSERLNEKQVAEFESIIKTNIESGSLSYPPEPGVIGSDIVKSNKIQYTAIIIMLEICLVSLIKYWQSVNLPTYTIYLINGASNGKIMLVALCESLLLCVSTYLFGLGINVVSRRLFSFSSTLTISDIIIGFGIYFGTFAIFTLINTAKICKQFSVSNIRRD